MARNCTLGKDAIGQHCKFTCGSCGWNPEVIKARNAQIAANGLTVRRDGVRRLIIRKEDVTDDRNT